jgi:hypothetical protein
MDLLKNLKIEDNGHSQPENHAKPYHQEDRGFIGMIGSVVNSGNHGSQPALTQEKLLGMLGDALSGSGQKTSSPHSETNNLSSKVGDVLTADHKSNTSTAATPAPRHEGLAGKIGSALIAELGNQKSSSSSSQQQDSGVTGKISSALISGLTHQKSSSPSPQKQEGATSAFTSPGSNHEGLAGKFGGALISELTHQRPSSATPPKQEGVLGALATSGANHEGLAGKIGGALIAGLSHQNQSSSTPPKRQGLMGALGDVLHQEQPGQQKKSDHDDLLGKIGSVIGGHKQEPPKSHGLVDNLLSSALGGGAKKEGECRVIEVNTEFKSLQTH